MDTLTDLLTDDEVPPGEYVVEVMAGVRLLWRISEGQPDDDDLPPDVMLLSFIVMSYEQSQSDISVRTAVTKGPGLQQVHNCAWLAEGVRTHVLAG